MKEVELSYGEVQHLETVHRHGRDPTTKRVITSILSRTHKTDGTDIIYETICNHDEKRDATKEESKNYGQSRQTVKTVCMECGTMWDTYGHIVRQRESHTE